MRYESLCFVAIAVGVVVSGLHALAFALDSPALRFTIELVFAVLLLMAIGLLLAPALPIAFVHRLAPQRSGLWVAGALLAAAAFLSGAPPVVLMTVRSLGVVALLEALRPRSRRADRPVPQPDPHRP